MNNNLKQELEMLERELGTPAFDKRLDKMKGLYTSDKDKALISEYISRMLSGIGTDLQEVNKELDTLRFALQDISKKIGSLSI